MALIYWLGSLFALVVFAYLVVALLIPEKF